MRFVYLSVVFLIVGLGLFVVNFDSLVLGAIERNPEELANIMRDFSLAKKAEAEKHEIQVSAKDPIFLDISKAPKKGKPDAKYKLVILTDFECPYCARLEATISELQGEYADDIQLAYKHLPLAFHKKAEPAARAAWAAQQQGKFFEYAEKLFENQPKLGPDLYLSTAKELGLNLSKFRLDQESSRAKEAVAKDLNEARSKGFTGTPVVLVNGIPVKGAYPLDYFKMVFDVINEQAE